jgi:outer membrane lipoprotein SlyB
MILRVLAVSMIGFTLAGCVSSSGLSGDVYSASEAKQVQSVTYGTIVHTRAVQIQSGDDSNAIGAIGGAVLGGFLGTPSAAVPDALWPRRQARSRAA